MTSLQLLSEASAVRQYNEITLYISIIALIRCKITPIFRGFFEYFDI
jgi:hypothetical protein